MDGSPTAVFTELHIDAARNATDDFNPFHDRHRWHKVENNPFPGPIALGFQVDQYIEDAIDRHRQATGDYPRIRDGGLDFSVYELKFVAAIAAGEPITIQIRDTRVGPESGELSNRIVVRNRNGPAIIGFKRELKEAGVAVDLTGIDRDALNRASDRDYVGTTGFFLKRKFLTTSNAKNFLAGSDVDQSRYIDEIAGMIRFPEVFCFSMLSCALLERGIRHGYDFMRNPMVYTSHDVSVDRRVRNSLHSNDLIHFLVREALPSDEGPRASGPGGVSQIIHECAGLTVGGDVIFVARIALSPLAEIVKRTNVVQV